MKHYLVRTIDVIERIYEVWADDEEMAELLVLDGPSESCIEHDYSLQPTQVLETEPVSRKFEC